MALSVHARLRVVLGILIGRYHPFSQGIDAVIQVLMDQDTHLDEYSPRDPHLKPKIPALLTRWVHIRIDILLTTS